MTSNRPWSSVTNVRFILCSVWLLCGACGGKSGSDADANAGGTITGTGGAGALTDGGATGLANTDGGAGAVTDGGATGLANTGGGAAGAVTDGGAAGLANRGGSRAITTGGAGSGSTGGTGGQVFCGTVTCPALPNSCKKIVQAADACCPTCTDTGCEPCAELTCDMGTHLETPVGACCPTCVVDPPDACATGQKTYASLRDSMVDKYGSSGCKNTSDCVLVPENNPCAWNCDLALPSAMSTSFVSNLLSTAQSCTTCPTLAAPICEQTIAACVNGKCVAVSSS